MKKIISGREIQNRWNREYTIFDAMVEDVVKRYKRIIKAFCEKIIIEIQRIYKTGKPE
ncbi:MAG: hypothetical protein ACYST3_07280 [Planctomycetota bacterium]|jgi:hypothetical protein